MNRNTYRSARCPVLHVRQWCLSALLLATPSVLLADDFLYEIRDSVLFITGYTGSGGEVTIPSTLDGHPVAAIGAYAFWNCSSLTSVSIPDSVATIGWGAFEFCSSLTNVTIPESVVAIGDSAFEGCSSLTSVSFPDSVKTIGVYAVASCERLEKVMVGSGVTFIDSVAFAYCPSLTNVTFAGNAPAIGWELFLGSSELTVYYMLGTTGWGDYFSGRPTEVSDYTYTLQSGGCAITRYTGHGVNVAIPSKVKGFYAVRWIGEGAFQSCSNLVSVIVPGCVAQIQPRAFQGCVSLESVTLCAPRSTELGMEAFSGCTGLTEVAFLGNAPQSVAADVFAGSPCVTVYCQPRGFGWGSTLADRPVVRLPFNYSVSLRGEATFCGFGSPASGSLTVPSRAGRYPITRIGGLAFLNAAGLTHIAFPETLTRVGVGAFLGCSGLEEIALPESVTAIESYAFAECTGVRRVAWGQGIKRVGVGAFSGCANLAGITLPAQVGCIEEQTFDQCSGLSAVVFGGDAVTNIAAGAFSGCAGLTNLALPASVAKIGSCAFSECFGLTEIALPAAVTDIWCDALSGCARLSAITVHPDNANYSSQDSVLFNKDGTSLIRFPEGRRGPYVVPAGTVHIADEAFFDCYGVTRIGMPASVSSMGASVFEGCISLTAIEVDAASVSYASQGGVLFSQTFETLLRYPPNKAGSSYTVPYGVTCIGDGAFEGCTGLKEITIPGSVTSIGETAFEGCEALEAIQVDESNGAYASRDGVLLTADQRELIRYPPAKTGDYAVPSGITFFRESAFRNCRLLTRITLPASLTYFSQYSKWDEDAFDGCSELTAIEVDPANGHFSSVNGVLMTGMTLLCCPGGKSGAYTVPADIRYIEANAFAGCSRLTAINVAASDGSCSSEDGVLFDRSKTTLLQCPGGKTGHYTVPASVRCIDVAAFLNCSSLTSIAIPASVTRIEPMAFFGCSALTSIAVDPTNTFYSSQGGTLFDKTGHRLIQYAGGETVSSFTVPASVSTLDDYSFWGRSSLTSLYFKGDQPGGMGAGTFYGTDLANVYYMPETSGWDRPFAGASLIAWDPRIQAGAGFGSSGNGQFGFTVSGANGMRVAVEASTNLNAAGWESVGSITVAPDGMAVFTDDAAASHRCRFYRLSMP